MKPIIPLSLFGSWFASPFEIFLMFTLITLLITVSFLCYAYYKKRQREEHSKLMRKKYEKYLLKLNFSDEELSYIHKLTTFLENDDLRYHMLTNNRTFTQCAAHLKKLNKNSKLLQQNIEQKLNFPSRKIGTTYFSSEDLPPGMPALILLSETRKISATIFENTRSSLILKLKKKIEPLREGTPIGVYFHDNQKIFTINTTVLKFNEDCLTISHSLLKSQKRRAFKRKKVKLPVVIKHMDYEETPMNSYIIDLSEGGASLENPDFNFKKDERITLYYHIDTEDGFQIRGEVLRLSAKGRILHVKFFDKDLTIRSRIKTIVK